MLDQKNLSKTKNSKGLIETERPGLKDYILGGEEQKKLPVLQENMDWTDYLPAGEKQEKEFETWACVSYATNNSLEIQLKRIWNLDINFSDRFLAKASDTVIGQGNYYKKVAQTVREEGLVKEKDYPWGGEDVKEYYKEIPDKLYKKANKEFKQNYEVNYRFVDWGGCSEEKLKQGLKHHPLVVSVNYSAVINNTVDKNTNHALVLVGIDDKGNWILYDSYHKFIKKVGPEFYFRTAMGLTIKKKNKFELYKTHKSNKVYFKDNSGVLHWIEDWESLQTGLEGGMWSNKIESIPKFELKKMEIGDSFSFNDKN